MSITTTSQSATSVAKKYCRIVLTENQTSWHRLVETTDGHLEYRLGAGTYKDWTTRSFRTLLRSVVQAAKSHKLAAIALEIDINTAPVLMTQGEAWTYRTMAENLALALYEFTLYKTKKKVSESPLEIIVCNIKTKLQKEAFATGLVVAEAANYTRDICNTSANEMTPVGLAKATQKALAGTKATVKVLTAAEIKKAKMGLLEAVGRGAVNPNRFIIIEYWGVGKSTEKKSTAKPIVLIGKGVTYDTGGLNIKPSGYMHEMHLDMSGGGAVIGALRAIAKLGLKKNVIGLIPAAENAVSGDSMRAGDIATSMSGQTVEILHTDAEGRLILADAITYAQKHYQPKVILDIATLTGAALVALGQQASAILTKDEQLQQTLMKLGEETGDLVWPLPLWEEYKASLKSTRADIANIATNFSRFGGTIEGGTFLSFFADKKIPWAHIDIAPRMESIASDKLAKGATGEPVRLLVAFVEQSV